MERRRIITIAEKHDTCTWNLDDERVLGMFSANVLKFKSAVFKVDDHRVVEDELWQDDAECGPVPYGAGSRCIRGAQAQIGFDLLTKILRSPGLLSLLG